jgi:uncharacterized membrane protein
MNKLIFLVALVLFTVNYLLYSFINLDLNIYHWHDTVRTVFGIQSGMLILISPGLAQAMFNKDK